MIKRTMKILGKRRDNPSTIEDVRVLQHTMNVLQGGALVPVGLYRFNSFQEADQWMIKQIAATHARRKSKISSRSAKDKRSKI